MYTLPHGLKITWTQLVGFAAAIEVAVAKSLAMLADLQTHLLYVADWSRVLHYL